MMTPTNAAPDQSPPNWRLYRLHFEQNRARPLPAAPSTFASAPWSLPLARVLARFQLGEAGEGRVAREIHAVRLSGIDADYRRALELFVKEEGRHARILAGLVRGLGGQLLSHDASNHLFRWCRRLLGLRFKLLVLLVAEVVGGEMYAALAGLPGTQALRPALKEITADEHQHLRFHADFLRGQARTRLARLVGRCALWGVGLVALAVVLLQNGRDLGRLRLDWPALAARMLATLRMSERAAFGCRQRRAVAPAWGHRP